MYIEKFRIWMRMGKAPAAVLMAVKKLSFDSDFFNPY
jgi:hypothetical protein